MNHREAESFLSDFRRRLVEKGADGSANDLNTKYLNLLVQYEKMIEEVKLTKSSHNPVEAKDILASFSRDEGLKFFTHEYDRSVGTFNYSKHIEKSSDLFQKLITSRREYLNKETYDRLWGFTKGTFFKTYGHSIQMAWGNTLLKDWCEANSEIYPSKYLLPKYIQFADKGNRSIKYAYFNDVINRFKFDIQLRTDDPWQTLDEIIKKGVNSSGLNTDFNLQPMPRELKNVDLFIDTVQIKSALSNFFEWIKKNKTRSTDLSVCLIDNADTYELDIKHLGSYVSWEPYAEKWNGLSGDLKTVRDILQNVCDWQMHVSTENNCRYTYPYLTRHQSINQPVQPTLISDWNADRDVTYKLILYK